MKNLKLLYKDERKIESGCSTFTTDTETSKFYIASDHAIFGYHVKNNEKCFDVDLTTCGLVPDPNLLEIVGLQFMCGEEQLCVGLKHGDILLCSTIDQNVDCVGSLDCEIVSMSWSPDQEIVLLVTSKGSVWAMNHDFDPITELEISAAQFGEGSFVNVGWGSKETQFQGSAGKYVPGKERQTPAAKVLQDDHQTKVAWRGDGQYFAISNIENEQRKFRVWNRNCELQYTSEILQGLESCFAWKPSGSLLASAQRKVHRHDIVFFEMNGLQHGEFTLPFDHDQVHVSKLEWNCDSSILLLWATNLKTQQVHLQLWCVTNYHWSLKRSLEVSEEITWAGWDTEETHYLHVLFKNGTYVVYHWSWCINCSKISSAPDHEFKSNDLSYVAVLDGPQVKLTPFSDTTVPPPMCAFQLMFQENVRLVCFLETRYSPNHLGVLTNSGMFMCFADKPTEFQCNFVHVKPMAMGGNGFTPQIIPLAAYASYVVDEVSNSLCSGWWKNLRHLVWSAKNCLYATCSSDKNDFIVKLTLDETKAQMICSDICETGHFIVAMCADPSAKEEEKNVIVQFDTGEVFQYSTSTTLVPFVDNAGKPVHLPFNCPDMQLCMFTNPLTNEVTKTLLSLSPQKRLFINNTVVSSQCTSFFVHNEYVIYSTSSHKLLFASRVVNVSDLEHALDIGKTTAKVTDEMTMSRSVERGASIVVVTPFDTKVVLQVPRGNLEIIHPRPLVISVVKQHLDHGRYKDTFVLMRKHRINMNLIHDHEPSKFFQNMSLFVKEIDSTDFLNLFLNELHEENVTETMYAQFYPTEPKCSSSLLTSKESKIDKICDNLLLEMIKQGEKKYFLSILTAHVKKTVPEIEKALGRLKSLKWDGGLEEKLINDALKHLHVLVDGRTLYQEALATYDLDLALMVSEVSNDDPKEYIPFLNSLKNLEANYKKYKIDMHLKKYQRALINISKCSDKFSDCLELVESQNLHREALGLFSQHCQEYKEISVSYANSLTKLARHEEAGVILARSGHYKDALKSFTKAHSWQHVLNCGFHMQYSPEDYKKLALSCAAGLLEENKVLDAASVYEELKECNKAFAVLCQGGLWTEALRLMRIYKLEEQTNVCLIPSLERAANNLISTLHAYREQFDRYYTRLIKVREIKKERQLRMLASGEGDLDSDIASDFGSTVTASSQNTMSSRASQKTGKSRRKQERKRFSLREGSRFEEEGLLQALRDVILKFSNLEKEFQSLVLHLALFHLDKEAKCLQDLHRSTQDMFVKFKPKIWVAPDENCVSNGGVQSTVNSILTGCTLSNAALRTEDLEVAIPPKLNATSKLGLHLYRN